MGHAASQQIIMEPLESRGFRSSHRRSLPISAPSARTSVRRVLPPAGKRIKLSKDLLYSSIKADAPDWYTDVTYADLNSSQMSRFVEHINLDKEIQRLSDEDHDVLTASIALDQYRNVGSAPDHRIQFKDANTEKVVIHRVDSRHSRIKRSGEHALS